MFNKRVVELARFQNVSFGYPNSFKILNDINFVLNYQDFYFLTGRSGVGKTTFLKLIYGEIFCNQGNVSIFGSNTTYLSQKDLRTIRQNIGIVFQEGRLFNHLTVLDNVALALYFTGKNIRHSRYIAYEFLDWVGLQGQQHKLPKELSDGQRQRVAIARAVITKPLIVLADEPTGNLDYENALKIMRLFIELHQKGTTIIFITHHNNLIHQFSYPEITLDNGFLIQKYKDRQYALSS